MDSFWRSPVRMLQPNLRMKDARGLEGRRLVRECRAYGANAILANGGGIVAWYPTSLSYQWRNPYLDHDFVGAAHGHRAGQRRIFVDARAAARRAPLARLDIQQQARMVGAGDGD